MNDNEKQKYSAPAVERVLDILEIMAKSDKSYTVTEIASFLDISVNSAFRIFNELMVKGYVVKNSADSSYELTSKLYFLGASIKNRVSYIKVAQPFMKRISDYTHETVILSKFRSDYSTLILDQIESTDQIKFISTVGAIYNSYCSANGKALLSTLDDEQLNTYLDSVKMIKSASNTITDKRLFLKEIERIRKMGVAFDDEEYIDGLSCIGCAVFSSNNKLEGAIGISGLKFRMQDGKREEYTEFIKEQARNLSITMGYKI